MERGGVDQPLRLVGLGRAGGPPRRHAWLPIYVPHHGRFAALLGGDSVEPGARRRARAVAPYSRASRVAATARRRRSPRRATRGRPRHAGLIFYVWCDLNPRRRRDGMGKMNCLGTLTTAPSAPRGSVHRRPDVAARNNATPWMGAQAPNTRDELGDGASQRPARDHKFQRSGMQRL